jgi:hypothetical protein
MQATRSLLHQNAANEIGSHHYLGIKQTNIVYKTIFFQRRNIPRDRRHKLHKLHSRGWSRYADTPTFRSHTTAVRRIRSRLTAPFRLRVFLLQVCGTVTPLQSPRCLERNIFRFRNLNGATNPVDRRVRVIITGICRVPPAPRAARRERSGCVSKESDRRPGGTVPRPSRGSRCRLGRHGDGARAARGHWEPATVRLSHGFQVPGRSDGHGAQPAW